MFPPTWKKKVDGLAKFLAILTILAQSPSMDSQSWMPVAISSRALAVSLSPSMVPGRDFFLKSLKATSASWNTLSILEAGFDVLETFSFNDTLGESLEDENPVWKGGSSQGTLMHSLND